MKTFQQQFQIDTRKPNFRSEAIGWDCEDPSLYSREPVGLNFNWEGRIPMYPHVLAALADGWKLLAPPTKQEGASYETWSWWLVRDLER